MLWAWPVEAGIFLLTWAGLLRIGEVIGAYRRDLILPQERRELCVHCSASRHRRRGDVLRDTSRQGSIRVTWSNIWLTFLEATSVIRSCGLCLHRHCGRGSICYRSALGLPTRKSHDSLPFDLGSFRPGGATDLLQRFEDSELVRRRGRWVSTKVLEIYLQEVSTAVFRTKLDQSTRSRIDSLAQAFTAIRLEGPREPCGRDSTKSMAALVEHTGIRMKRLEVWEMATMAFLHCRNCSRDETSFWCEK